MEDVQKEAPLLEAEVVSDEKAAIRAKNREKKRAQRVRDKAKKDAATAKKDEARFATMLNNEWWTMNRNKDLTKAQQATYAAREEEVIALEIEIENFLFANIDRISYEYGGDKYRLRLQKYREQGLIDAADLDLSAEQVADLVRRVNEDEDANGTRCGWMDFDFAGMREYFPTWFKDQGGTRTFVLYGYMVALDENLYNRLHDHTRVSTRSCGVCGKKSPMPSGWVKRDYYCEGCEAKRNERANAAFSAAFARLNGGRVSDVVRPFDAFGRRVDE